MSYGGNGGGGGNDSMASGNPPALIYAVDDRPSTLLTDYDSMWYGLFSLLASCNNRVYEEYVDTYSNKAKRAMNIGNFVDKINGLRKSPCFLGTAAQELIDPREIVQGSPSSSGNNTTRWTGLNGLIQMHIELHYRWQVEKVRLAAADGENRVKTNNFKASGRSGLKEFDITDADSIQIRYKSTGTSETHQCDFNDADRNKPANFCFGAKSTFSRKKYRGALRFNLVDISNNAAKLVLEQSGPGSGKSTSGGHGGGGSHGGSASGALGAKGQSICTSNGLKSYTGNTNDDFRRWQYGNLTGLTNTCGCRQIYSATPNAKPPDAYQNPDFGKINFPLDAKRMLAKRIVKNNQNTANEGWYPDWWIPRRDWVDHGFSAALKWTESDTDSDIVPLSKVPTMGINQAMRVDVFWHYTGYGADEGIYDASALWVCNDGLTKAVEISDVYYDQKNVITDYKTPQWVVNKACLDLSGGATASVESYYDEIAGQSTKLQYLHFDTQNKDVQNAELMREYFTRIVLQNQPWAFLVFPGRIQLDNLSQRCQIIPMEASIAETRMKEIGGFGSSGGGPGPGGGGGGPPGGGGGGATPAIPIIPKDYHQSARWFRSTLLKWQGIEVAKAPFSTMQGESDPNNNNSPADGADDILTVGGSTLPWDTSSCWHSMPGSDHCGEGVTRGFKNEGSSGWGYSPNAFTVRQGSLGTPSKLYLLENQWDFPPNKT